LAPANFIRRYRKLAVEGPWSRTNAHGEFYITGGSLTKITNGNYGFALFGFSRPGNLSSTDKNVGPQLCSRSAGLLSPQSNQHKSNISEQDRGDGRDVLAVSVNERANLFDDPDFQGGLVFLGSLALLILWLVYSGRKR
jgi:hypothetical protein